jgi:hypothetical protein
MIVSLNSGLVILNVLAVIFSLAAIAVSVLRKGANAQAVRAVAVVGVFTMGFWLGLAALVWAVVDFVLPSADIKITTAKPGKKK